MPTMRHMCVTVPIGVTLSIPGAVRGQTGSQAGGLREVALSVGLEICHTAKMGSAGAARRADR